ncbi:MAG: MotA/TolQ/ExbB proton channel family protein, partial [Verrucomicrobiales bacterium]|nr:MotA/TolQ/ExbB proton channel family protein [Verrucomicrobiales bacterium]
MNPPSAPDASSVRPRAVEASGEPARASAHVERWTWDRLLSVVAAASVGSTVVLRWVFDGGWATYAGLAGCFVTLGYALGVRIHRLLPGMHGADAEWAPFGAAVDRLLGVGTECRRLEELAFRAGIHPDGCLSARLRTLDRLATSGTRDRESLYEANQRMTAADERRVAHVLQPLALLRWILPMLGVLGTVWSLRRAAGGVGEGMRGLVGEREIAEAALSRIGIGIEGSAWALDATIVGLIGSVLAASLHFFLRARAMNAVLRMESACDRAIPLLRLETGPLGKLEEIVREGLFETDAAGEIVRDEQGRPKCSLSTLVRDWENALRRGLFETDDRGVSVADASGRPVFRIQRSLDLLLRGLFVTDVDGQVLAREGGIPIERSAAARNRLYQLLSSHVYEPIPGAVPDPEGPPGRTVTGREAPLRSRFERRHAETMAYLEIVTRLLLLESKGVGSRDKSGAGGAEFVPVLAATGRPVSAMTLNDARFAVARGSVGSDDGEAFELVCGTWMRVAGFVRPIASTPGLRTRDRVAGLQGWNGFLARSIQGSATVELGDWGVGLPHAFACDRGNLDSGLLGILGIRGVPHPVAVVVDDRGRSTWVQWDGTAPNREGTALATMEERVEAFATRPGAEIGCLVRGAKGISVVLLGAGRSLSTTPFSVALKALAFAPDAVLWC